MAFVVFVVAAAALIGWWVIYTVLSLAPWVPSRRRDFARIVQLADLQVGEVFVDLGAGDGRVVRFVARSVPQVKARGVELAFWPWLASRVAQLFKPLSNVRYSFGNMYAADVSSDDVVFIFGTAATMNNRVQKKIIPQMKKGARLISYNFDIINWSGKMVHSKPTDKDTSIRVYYI